MQRPTPTNKEKIMRENDFIVSKTDLRGKITYGNRIFIEFSGYSEKELLGAPHSIIRHPDMPRGVFKYLWDAINNGEEVHAYVKNLSKDGSFYWVYAHVTPSYDKNGKIIGFLSARRKPNIEAIKILEPVYKLMLEAENKASKPEAPLVGLQVLVDILNSKGVSYEELIHSIS